MSNREVALYIFLSAAAVALTLGLICELSSCDRYDTCIRNTKDAVACAKQ